MNLLIRDVPDEVRDTLAARARSRGLSMQAYLLELLGSDARSGATVRRLAAVRAVPGGISDGGSVDESAVVAELRKEREWRLGPPRAEP